MDYSPKDLSLSVPPRHPQQPIHPHTWCSSCWSEDPWSPSSPTWVFVLSALCEPLMVHLLRARACWNMVETVWLNSWRSSGSMARNRLQRTTSTNDKSALLMTATFPWYNSISLNSSVDIEGPKGIGRWTWCWEGGPVRWRVDISTEYACGDDDRTAAQGCTAYLVATDI